MNMGQSTKERLFQSFKSLVEEKPLGKITISDITERVGVNRHTFYYHFKDERDLMEWGIKECLERTRVEAIKGGMWIDSMDMVLEKAEMERKFILTLFHSHLKEEFCNIICGWSFSIFDKIIREKSKGQAIKEQDVQFIIKILTYGLTGIVVDWLEGGMMESHKKLCEQVRTLIGDSFEGAIQKFVK